MQNTAAVYQDLALPLHFAGSRGRAKCSTTRTISHAGVMLKLAAASQQLCKAEQGALTCQGVCAMFELMVERLAWASAAIINKGHGNPSSSCGFVSQQCVWFSLVVS